MWNAIDAFVTTVKTVIAEATEEVLEETPSSKLPELMAVSNEKQPTDYSVGAHPALWQFNARSFEDLGFILYHRHFPPPVPVFYRPFPDQYPVTAHRVRVNPPSSDYLADRVAPIPKPTAVHTEMDAHVTPAAVTSSPMPVVDAKEPSTVVLLSVGTPAVTEEVRTPAGVRLA